MKNNRQNLILKIVSENNIGTQEQLQQKLHEHGFDVTQATVSRDIKELSLIKTATASGNFKYSVPALTKNSMENADGMILTMLSNGVVSVDYALNTVVVKCHTGMAQAVCAKLDSLKLENVVGTLAGDDTVFILMRTENDASRLVRELGTVIKTDD